MIRRISITILLVTLCAVQSSILTSLVVPDATQQKPSAEELERMAQEIGNDLNEGRQKLGMRKWYKLREDWDDRAWWELGELFKKKLTPEALVEYHRRGKRPKLEGMAEDLWDNRLDLSKYSKGLVWLHPFSPSYCGYCLVEGEFVRVNYYENAEREGDRFFGMCLFNPQLDVYSFLKHYREDFPVLTAPPSLYGDYHNGGFPYMTVFKDGELLYSDHITPYEEEFYTLRARFWKDRNISLRPTSPLKLAHTFIAENRSQLAVYVCPDGDEASFRRRQERYKDWQALTVKYESQLTEEDYRKNLDFSGITEHFGFKLFEGQEMPIKITSESIQIGDYEFPKSEIGLNACFPNPLNRERYIVLGLRGSNSAGCSGYERWVDYVICRNGPNGKPETLLHGFFEKDNGIWKFSPSLVHGSEASRQFCRNGVCPAPGIGPLKHATHRDHKTPQPKYEATPQGKLWTLGSSECRFPSMLVDRDGICWTVWEEHGDITLSSVNKSGDQKVIYVEDDSSDSFNPLLAMDEEHLWVFYLNDQDGFYRVYGKYFDGRHLSDEILFSEKEPLLDVVTPGVAFNDQGKMVVSWSEWQANGRILKYLTVEERILGQAQVVERAGESGFAWCPSLVLDDNGKLWGTWNQHYPTTLCVCAGDMIHEAEVVDDRGGYPSIVLDQNGSPWVFWQSSMWNAWRGPQTISASYYDSEKQKWSLPYTLSLKNQTILNQTPKAAVDKDGRICVVWSGRKDETCPWNIYLSHFEENKWSDPEMVSPESENARAPAIFIDENEETWLTWHSGTGSEMKVKVLRFRQ